MNFRRIREKINEPAAFDVNSIEDEIGELVSQEVPRRPLQDYAAHQTKEAMYHAQQDYAPPATIQQIGQMTATAVMAQTEAAVKSALEYKELMQGWTSEYQTALADLDASMKYIDDKVQRFREIGQANHDGLMKLSENITEFNTKARALCDDIQAKIDQTKLPDPSTPEA